MSAVEHRRRNRFCGQHPAARTKYRGGSKACPPRPIVWRLVILLSLGGCFEIYDLFFTGYIAPGLDRSGLLTTTTQAFFGFSGIGAFVAATFAGLFVGTFFLGFLADRFGRRSIFTFALLGYTRSLRRDGVPDHLRRPAVVALHRRHRHRRRDHHHRRLYHRTGAKLDARPRLCGQSGRDVHRRPDRRVPAWWLVPLSPYGIDGWRWVVLIGAAASMVIWVLRLYVPESPLWLARHGSGDEATR